jgi:SAM-dependent methyltransferase
VYGDDYFRSGGAGYPDYLADSELLRGRGRRYADLVRRFTGPPGRVLDVGAAAGFLLAGVRDRGWSGEGVEPNDRMAAHGREKLGLTIHTGTLETATPTGPFDLVNFVQVVAHFPDPLAAFRAADRVTRPGGHWLVETWNCDSLTARVWGEGWHEYSPPSVLHWFGKRSLRRALGRLGYRQVGCGTPQKWISAVHAKSLLRHTLAGRPAGRAVLAAANLIPDRLSIPYPSEDLFWAVFRKESEQRPDLGDVA